MFLRPFHKLALSGILAPVAFACSIPQFNPATQAAVPSPDQLLSANHFRKALVVLSAKPPDSSQSQLLLSRAQLGLGQFGPAMDSAEKALAADPKNPAVHVQLAAVAGRTAEHASMFKQLSLAKRVKKELDEALTLDPKNPDAFYGLVLYSDLAPSFLGGSKERAWELAQKLTELSPARGYLAQATLAHNRKDAPGEEAFLKKAVAADSQSYDAHLALAVFLSHADPPHFEQADEQACQALYMDPARAEAWQLLTEQAASDNLLEMNGLLSVYQKFNPEDRSPAYHAAVGLIGTGKDLDHAQELLKHYLETPPDGNAPSAGLAHYQLALIAEKQHKNAEALDLLHIALSEDPTLEDARKEQKRLEHASPLESVPSH